MYQRSISIRSAFKFKYNLTRSHEIHEIEDLTFPSLPEGIQECIQDELTTFSLSQEKADLLERGDAFLVIQVTEFAPGGIFWWWCCYIWSVLGETINNLRCFLTVQDPERVTAVWHWRETWCPLLFRVVFVENIK